jgi:transposase
MGVPFVFLGMFLRKKSNKSGSVSVQIISKHIEKAFRMSKTDLRIRPIYHRLRHRIEAHICISFTAYCIYKELERVLYKEKSTLSVKKAAELTQNMYQITYTLPESKHTKSNLLKMDDQQALLYQIIQKNF